MKILLAVDGSPHSDPPVQVAAARPWPAGTVLQVFSVVESHASPGIAAAGLVTPAAYNDAQAMMNAEAESLVSGIAQRLRAAGLSVETAVGHGSNASHQIVEHAHSWGADLVLIGSRGRTGLKRVLMGSVAQYVVAHAHCSVEVVRAPASAAAHSASV